jgi:hypothetical protein
MLWVPCNASSFFFFLLTLAFVVVVFEAFSYTQKVPVRSTYSPDRVLSGREVLTRYYIAQQSAVSSLLASLLVQLTQNDWSMGLSPPTSPLVDLSLPLRVYTIKQLICPYTPSFVVVRICITSHANSVGSQLEKPKKKKKSIRVNWHEKNTTTGQWRIWINNEAIIIIRWNWRIFIFDIQQSILCLHTIFDLMLIESHHQIELSSGKLRQRQLPHTYTENNHFGKITRCVTRPSLSTAMDKAPWYGIREFRVYPKE